jgi:hypothetical protein
MTHLFRGAFDALSQALRKAFRGKPKVKTTTRELDPSIQYIRFATGTVVSISDGPHGVFAIVRLPWRKQKASFLVTANSPEKIPEWRHKHPPHVHQPVLLRGLRRGKKPRQWLASSAERA